MTPVPQPAADAGWLRFAATVAVASAAATATVLSAREPAPGIGLDDASDARAIVRGGARADRVASAAWPASAQRLAE